MLVPVGQHKGQQPLPLNRLFTLIGSAPSARLYLPSKTVSRCHAVIINTDGGLFIRDLASRTQVRVNGKPLPEADLREGDVIQVGQFTFRFTDPTAAGKPRPPAPPPPPAASLDIEGLDEPLRLETRTLLIGRRETADISLTENAASSAHTLLFVSEGRHLVRDLSSRTGTYVNGVKVHEHALTSGDVVKVGETSFRYLRSAAGVKSEARAASAAAPQPAAIPPEPEADALAVEPEGDAPAMEPPDVLPPVVIEEPEPAPIAPAGAASPGPIAEGIPDDFGFIADEAAPAVGASDAGAGVGSGIDGIISPRMGAPLTPGLLAMGEAYRDAEPPSPEIPAAIPAAAGREDDGDDGLDVVDLDTEPAAVSSETAEAAGAGDEEVSIDELLRSFGDEPTPAEAADAATGDLGPAAVEIPLVPQAEELVPEPSRQPDWQLEPELPPAPPAPAAPPAAAETKPPAAARHTAGPESAKAPPPAAKPSPPPAPSRQEGANGAAPKPSRWGRAAKNEKSKPTPPPRPARPASPFEVLGAADDLEPLPEPPRELPKPPRGARPD